MYLKRIFSSCPLGKFKLGTITHLVLKLKTLFYFLLTLISEWRLALPIPSYLQGMVSHGEGIRVILEQC